MPSAPSTKKVNAGPGYYDLIKEAVLTLKERTGSSRHAIDKFVAAKKGAGYSRSRLNIALKRGVESGKLVAVKGSFKLAADEKKEKKEKKPKTAKKTATKPAAKKKTTSTSTKKPAAKSAKKSTKSSTASKKKPAAKKVSKTTKKVPAKKPTTTKKKTVKKSAANKVTKAKKD